jgi:hypothetical protein
MRKQSRLSNNSVVAVVVVVVLDPLKAEEKEDI